LNPFNEVSHIHAFQLQQLKARILSIKNVYRFLTCLIHFKEISTACAYCLCQCQRSMTAQCHFFRKT